MYIESKYESISLFSSYKVSAVCCISNRNCYQKKKLLSEDSLTFKKCVELSVAKESASNDVKKWEQPEVNYQKSSKWKTTKNNNIVIRKGQSTLNYGKFKTGASENSRNRKVVCYCCGAVGNKEPSCRYTILSCTNCKKVGHLKKVCQTKTKNVNNVAQNSVDDLNLNLSNFFRLESVNVNVVKPLCIKLDVNNKLIEFQVNTGLAETVLSQKDIEHYSVLYLENLEKTDIS